MQKKEEKKKQIFLKINELKIMMDLNLENGKQKAPELFQYSVLSHPELEQAEILKGKTYNLPFFTNMTLYPELLIRNKTYPERVQFFFDRDIFNKTLLNNLDNLVDLNVMDNETLEEEKKKMAANEKENIMVMLNALFPLHGSMNSVLRSSYDHNIMEGYNLRVLKDLDILNVFDLGGIFSFFNILNVDNNATYLKLSKGTFMVKSIVWENDMVNHPVYNKFIIDYTNVLGTIQSETGKINREIQKYEDDLKNAFSKVDIEDIIQSLESQLKSLTSSRSSEGNTSFQINSVILLFKELNKPKNPSDYLKQICSTTFKIYNILSNLNVSLGNESDDMTKFYKLCIKLEAAYRVQKLLTFGLIYSVSTEQIDETTGEKKEKSRTEKDIIGALNSSLFRQYTNNNTKLANTISTIYPPNRKTSNTMLLDMLKKKKTGSWKSDNELNDLEKEEQDKAKEAIENIYDKYFANSPLNISTGLFKDYIYTGVDTIGGKSENESQGEEYCEIYVRIDVLNKDNYKKTKIKSCSITSDDLVNTYKNLELANSEIPLNNAFRMYDINNIANIADKVAEAAAVKKGGYTYKRSISRQSNTIRRSKSKRTRRYTK